MLKYYKIVFDILTAYMHFHYKVLYKEKNIKNKSNLKLEYKLMKIKIIHLMEYYMTIQIKHN